MNNNNPVPEKKMVQAKLDFTKMNLPTKKRKLEVDDNPHGQNNSKCLKFDNEVLFDNANDNASFLIPQVVLTKCDPLIQNTQQSTSCEHDISIKSFIPNIPLNNETSSTDFSLVLEADTLDSITAPSIKKDVNISTDVITMIDDENIVPNKVTTEKKKNIDDTLTAEIKVSLEKKFTPKQLQKKLETQKRKEEQDRIKQERERKKQEEKEAKEKKRLAEIEARNKEKQQKEEERKAKVEERRKQKEEENRLKEERRLKEEERRKQKEEEKRLREEKKIKEEEEKKRQKEEQEKRKQKSTIMITNYFQPKTKPEPSVDSLIVTNDPGPDSTQNNLFMPFEVKANVKLAKCHRCILSHERKANLDKVITQPSFCFKTDELYLHNLKSGCYKPGHSADTWPLNDNDDKSDSTTCYRSKLLQFSENRRPAYWGTWRKRSKIITGKTPFNCDKELFDYDVDSDDEWVEEPGESLHGSDDEKESDDDYDVDREFMVPHGYLSDEEIQSENGADDNENGCPNETKLHLMEEQLVQERKEKTYKLKPRCYGCLWVKNDTEESSQKDVLSTLTSFKGVFDPQKIPYKVMKEPELPAFPQPKTATIAPVIKIKKPSITKFLKKLTPEEKEKQLLAAVKKSEISSSTANCPTSVVANSSPQSSQMLAPLATLTKSPVSLSKILPNEPQKKRVTLTTISGRKLVCSTPPTPTTNSPATGQSQFHSPLTIAPSPSLHNNVSKYVNNKNSTEACNVISPSEVVTGATIPTPLTPSIIETSSKSFLPTPSTSLSSIAGTTYINPIMKAISEKAEIDLTPSSKASVANITHPTFVAGITAGAAESSLPKFSVQDPCSNLEETATSSTVPKSIDGITDKKANEGSPSTTLSKTTTSSANEAAAASRNVIIKDGKKYAPLISMNKKGGGGKTTSSSS